MYWKKFNDANIEKGNWKIYTRGKDWMLRLADKQIIKISSKSLLVSDNRTNIYLPTNIFGISKNNQKIWTTKHESIENKLQSRTS